jgi:uncharacterized membrane protein
MQIRNPIEWGYDQIRLTAIAVGSAGRAVRGAAEEGRAPPTVRRIAVADLRDVLARGFDDFGVSRGDVIFLCIIYPIVGLLLARLVVGYEVLPLLFPIASGFALIGPVAAVGLYEMSRRREQGIAVTWADAFGVVRSPSYSAIALLGLLLLAIFLLWLGAAWAIYALTLGPAPPASIAGFVRDVLTTPAGWALIGVGVGVGFLFAVLVLAISVVSFPLLVDRDPCRRGEPETDGRLGDDRRRRAGAGIAARVSRPRHRHASARARHLAPLPQGGAALKRRPSFSGAFSGSLPGRAKPHMAAQALGLPEC